MALDAEHQMGTFLEMNRQNKIETVYSDDGVNMPSFVDRSFYFHSKTPRSLISKNGSDVREYCIDLMKYGALSFMSTTPLPVNATVLGLILRVNASSAGVEQIHNLEIQLEYFDRNGSYVSTRPIGIFDAAIHNTTVQDPAADYSLFLEGKPVFLAIPLANLEDENWNQEYFNQIHIGWCLEGMCQHAGEIAIGNALSICVQSMILALPGNFM